MGSKLISSDNNTLSIAKNKKEMEYNEYIKEHVGNVIKSFNKYFIPLCQHIDSLPETEYFTTQELYDSIKLLEDRIFEHDISKYSDEEFEPYREKYYPTIYESESMSDELKQKIEKDAEVAWMHHYQNNPHHPNYWVDKESNKPIDMDLISIIEMICDWEAMNIKFGGNTIDWYNNKADKEKSYMTEKTKHIVEFLMNIIYKNK